MPPEQGEGRLPRRAARGVQPRRASADEIAAARAELGIAPGRLRDRHGHAAARVEGQLVSGRRRARWCSTSGRRRGSSSSAKGRCAEPLEAQARALGLGDRFVFAGFATRRRRASSRRSTSSVFPSLWEGTPLTVFEALAMGKADRRHRRGRPARHAHRRARRARSCRSAMPAALAGGDRPADRRARTSARGLARRARADRAAVRHRRVRPQDGAALRPAAPRVARRRSGRASCARTCRS